ncbi:hypothetical protein BKA64DRAFT_681262 [Cadophora sp. MPI-SDFR-AT-0126]|nr:hypothetical protein BKA64DRAFT_681262 [Leotiomycetes sp. MPI-SDFR-AT-0126]
MYGHTRSHLHNFPCNVPAECLWKMRVVVILACVQHSQCQACCLHFDRDIFRTDRRDGDLLQGRPINRPKRLSRRFHSAHVFWSGRLPSNQTNNPSLDKVLVFVFHSSYRRFY